MASNIPATVRPAPYDFSQLEVLDTLCQSPHTENAQSEAGRELASMSHYVREAIYKRITSSADYKETYRHMRGCLERDQCGVQELGEHHALDDLNRLGEAVRSYAIELCGSPSEDTTQVLLRTLTALRPNQDFRSSWDAATFHAIFNLSVVGQFLNAKDYGCFAEVNRAFRDTISMDEQLWNSFHDREGIPRVQGFVGEVRNYRRDFLNLSGTYGRKIIEALLPLKMVDPIPKIQRAVFTRLYEQDPFQRGVSIGKNYVFVVVPGLVRTKNDQVAPLSLEKLRYLQHAIEGGGSIFSQLSVGPIFQHCAQGSKETRVLLMRKHVPNQSRDMHFDAQKTLVSGHQMQVTDLLPRALLDALKILGAGECDDARVPQTTHVRCSDAVVINNILFQTTIGGFAPRTGLLIGSGQDDDNIGVVPCIRADVPPVPLPE